MRRLCTDRPWEPDFRGLIARAEQVPIAGARLRWTEWTRRSNRQAATLRMGGITGWFELPEPLPPELWEPLWEGQWLHAGKATVMGFGRYTVHVD